MSTPDTLGYSAPGAQCLKWSRGRAEFRFGGVECRGIIVAEPVEQLLSVVIRHVGVGDGGAEVLVTRRAATIFGWTGACAVEAAWIVDGGFAREDRFEVDGVAPAVAEVVKTAAAGAAVGEMGGERKLSVGPRGVIAHGHAVFHRGADALAVALAAIHEFVRGASAQPIASLIVQCRSQKVLSLIAECGARLVA